MNTSNISITSDVLPYLRDVQEEQAPRLLKTLYDLVDASSLAREFTTVKNCAQRFLDFYLTNTLLPQHILDAAFVDIENYRTKLFLFADGLIIALQTLCQIHEGEEVSYYTEAIHTIYDATEKLNEAYETLLECLAQSNTYET
jgi:hypothetical protein